MENEVINVCFNYACKLLHQGACTSVLLCHLRTVLLLSHSSSHSTPSEQVEFDLLIRLVTCDNRLFLEIHCQ